MIGKLRRGLISGLGYGAAVAIVDLAFGTWNFTKLNLPAFTGTVVESAAIEIALGALIGLVAAPLAGSGRDSGLGHLAAMTAMYLAAACWVAVDRAAIPMWASPAVLGAVLVLAGRRLDRHWHHASAALGAFVLAAICLVPALYQRAADSVRKQRPLPSARAQDDSRPDVVVVVLDTVRAANMSAYGYGLRTTPVFETLAREGALFFDASAPGTWSLPSHASLFTGLFPSVHGATEEHRVLSVERPTLASVLAKAGYQTVAFTANPWISDHLGLTRGFDWSDEAWRDGGGGRAFFFSFRLLDKLGFGPVDKGGGEVASHFEDWEAVRPKDAQPAFAFLNFLEAHFPHHQLPKEFLHKFTRMTDAEQHEYSRRLFATQFGPPMSGVGVEETLRPAREMYDAGIAYTDSLLGRVVEALRRRGTLDRTLLVVLADHGELIGEHGEFGHGISIFQPTMRVPLLVRLPGTIKPTTVTQAVSTAGVFATVLDVLSMNPPPPQVVPSLLPTLDGRPGGLPVVAERFAGEASAGRTHPLFDNKVLLRAYRSGSLKLVETSKGASFLYDIENDPDEETDLAKERPEDVERLKAELEAWRGVTGMPPLDAPVMEGTGDETLDPAAKERLKALGYVE